MHTGEKLLSEFLYICKCMNCASERMKIACSRCNGTGKIAVTSYTNTSGRTSYWRCDDCKGSGRK